MKNAAILVISDLHTPHNHCDAVAFITGLVKTYKPDRVVLIGDEVDMHAVSYHEHDPNLSGPSEELEAGIRILRKLYALFPKADVIESNHGSLLYRKAKTAGIPAVALRSYNEILGAPVGWRWHRDLFLVDSTGHEIYFHHAKTQVAGKLSHNMACSTVEGHHHSKFSITYWANPRGVYFGLQVGCLIDDDSMAMAYNRTTMDRPILGCAIILDGKPKLLPMEVNESGRWTRKIP